MDPVIYTSEDEPPKDIPFIPPTLLKLLHGTWYCDKQERIYMVALGSVWTERGDDAALRALLFDMDTYGSIAVETMNRHGLALVAESLYKEWNCKEGFKVC